VELVELKTDNFTLQIDISNKSWRTLFLYQNNVAQSLRSDSLKIILEKFILILDPQTFPKSSVRSSDPP
jgi:hypothetical protein